MLKLVTFVALILATSAMPPKPCCLPDQYIAGIGMSVGQVINKDIPVSYLAYYYGALDFTKRTFGLRTTTLGKGMTQAPYNLSIFPTRVILNYAENIQWIIDDESQICDKTPAPLPEPQNCIPANATYLAETTVGGKGQLIADSWYYDLESPFVEGSAYVTVARDSCYMLSNVFSAQVNSPGETPYQILSSSAVVNMTIGIPDPDTWFTVPEFCNQKSNNESPSLSRADSKLKTYPTPFFL